MQPAKPIILPQEQIAAWHKRLLQSARRSADLCLKACGDSEEHKNVRRLVGHSKICHLLGAPPDGVKLATGQHIYDYWLRCLWGRRCSYYFSTLLAGLRAASNIDPQPKELADLVEQLDVRDKRLAAIYNQSPDSQLTAERSLTSRRDIANFHVTYLDPILFSSLYHLARLKRKRLPLSDEATKVLWTLIKREVGKSTRQGKGKSDQIIDESTVWWGFIELVRRDGKDFQLGKFHSWDGVVQICQNLMNANGGAIRWPQIGETLREATPEIYGQTRTRVLVAKNCIELAKLVPRKALAGIRDSLSSFVEEQFAYAMDDSAGVLQHMCLIGLGLELSSNALALLSAQNAGQSKRSRKVEAVFKEKLEVAEIKKGGPAEQEWIKVFRGLGEPKSTIDSCRLRLPSKFCKRLGPMRKDKWLVFALDPKCLIAFPDCLWDLFWASAEHELQITSEKIREFQQTCETVEYNTQTVTKREKEYLNEYWVIPTDVIKKLNFSGEDQKFSPSKITIKCRISHSTFWLKILPESPS